MGLEKEQGFKSAVEGAAVPANVAASGVLEPWFWEQGVRPEGTSERCLAIASHTLLATTLL